MNSIKMKSHIILSGDNDSIKKLIDEHGFEGYGIYMVIEEKLNQCANELKIEKSLADKMGVDYEKLKSIICDYGLFHVKYRDFYSYNYLEFDDNNIKLPKPFKNHVNFIGMKIDLIPAVASDLNKDEKLKLLVQSDLTNFSYFAAYRRTQVLKADITKEVSEFLELKKEGLL